MEYEYLITSNSSKINRSVVICGVNAFHDSLPYSLHTCWGQSYGIIRAEVDTHQAPTNPSSYELEAIYIDCAASSSTSSIYPLIIIITFSIVIIILFVIILLLTVGLLHLRDQSRIRIAPPCVQTVEQTLVIKVEEPVAIESAAVREKETSFSEKSDSSRSSIQAQLQEKLPDTISSRSTTL